MRCWNTPSASKVGGLRKGALDSSADFSQPRAVACAVVSVVRLTVAVRMAVRVRPFAVVVRLMALGLHGDAQSVASGVAGGFDVEVSALGKSGKGFLDGDRFSHVRRGWRERRRRWRSDRCRTDVFSHADIHRAEGINCNGR